MTLRLPNKMNKQDEQAFVQLESRNIIVPWL